MLPVLKTSCFLPLEIGTILVLCMSLVLNLYAVVYLLPNILEPSALLNYNLISGLVFATFFVHIISCILAVVGAQKKNSKLLLPWLFGQIVEIVVLLIVGFFVLVSSTELHDLILYTLSVLVYIPFQIYFWLCVYSLYYQITSHPGNEAPACIAANDLESNITTTSV